MSAVLPLFEMRKVTKAYRGVPAIKEVDFDLREGEIHALVGENGAGKSTLTKLMAGAITPTSGAMLHAGKEVAFASPWEAIGAGIAMVFQETSLVPSLTVAQNLYLGDEKFLNRLRGITIAAQSTVTMRVVLTLTSTVRRLQTSRLLTEELFPADQFACGGVRVPASGFDPRCLVGLVEQHADLRSFEERHRVAAI